MVGDWGAVAQEVDVLARRAQAGDGDALTELVERYQPLLRAHARAVYRDGDVMCSPEDALQEAAVVFIRSVGEYRPERGAFGPFVKRNVFWGLVRQRRRSTPRLSTQALDEVILERLERSGKLATWDPPRADEPGESHRLHEAFRWLTAHQRRVLALYYWLDLPAAEIAARLGVSVRAVNLIRQRAERRLRAVLSGQARARGRPPK